jgi:mercuric ion transport protein
MQWKQYLSVGVAMLTCPCHLPILVAALVGTALGGWLSQHSLEVTLGMAGMFVLALLYSLRTLTRPETMPESRGQARKETGST